MHLICCSSLPTYFYNETWVLTGQKDPKETWVKCLCRPILSSPPPPCPRLHNDRKLRDGCLLQVSNLSLPPPFLSWVHYPTPPPKKLVLWLCYPIFSPSPPTAPLHTCLSINILKLLVLSIPFLPSSREGPWGMIREL